jgi:sugar O-acyltransferase (sialic acid O-acetyltransferase NeuD family)
MRLLEEEMKTIAVVGAGGFAREVKWLLRDIGGWECVGFLADRRGQHDSDVLGDFSWLEHNHVDALAIGIGHPGHRFRLGHMLSERFPHLQWPSLVHPSVRFDADSCSFGSGSIICAGTILTVNVCVGRFAMINLSCTVGHETNIGSGAVINPLCAISGGVKIGDRVLVGTHSSILQYVTVGDDATVASAAMVNKDVAPATTVMGVPAKAGL